ncbi:hypothetical protein A3C91_03310 [Candidatus Azambacteria bacterium RIFCSPHIGHO2_02_FULL_52_12]|uniref:Large ribosomal subunit protein uL15 n=1 Tax=Candidatus Azambacteria bacterium RIFCSPLOWO2_01_FULL_46_25 TaxID=1797298 RepID=A0A1F5BU50_9BACT|nr:MAG: hypothetical protein A3C91_03310 [Candidatus Azambacteria bacterium RIFCSPHIGHO2_02_FULL_52_12]OGD34125.1 MAG: hypothetical protein A2988_01445 [Candidatus Azambacteria bacterium RIFCSPLOWO2_01_FULL_46_25]OGD36724.1 MAG: hypothetical protein A2850_00400 [Candidatus Azambacteria bacterium RIFCSPHIGHO2_01_FULL_51_74]
MQLDTLRPKHTTQKEKRIARGGKKGTTSGKGTKGQKSRAGHKIRPAERDMIKKLPKLRGRGTNQFKSFGVRDVPVNIRDLERAFTSGDTVTPKSLVEKGLVAKRGGAFPMVKILGMGTLTKKLTIEGCGVSASARAEIEKHKGEIVAKRLKHEHVTETS